MRDTARKVGYIEKYAKEVGTLLTHDGTYVELNLCVARGRRRGNTQVLMIVIVGAIAALPQEKKRQTKY